MKRINIKYIIAAFLLIISLGISAQSQKFKVVSASDVTSIIIDEQEAKVVDIAAHLLSKDIYSTTGKTVTVGNGTAKWSIIAGTVGNSTVIDNLIASNTIDASAVQGRWETFSLQVVNKPMPGVKKGLVIVGSDRRGTAFGLLEVSRMIGVSPWEWWADVTPKQTEECILSIEPKVYGEPSVKYRGLFLNDEDWGLQRWAALNLEPETGDLGPKTYAKVFELLLRLRANTIWPAMHSCTKPFYSYPENKRLADDYAIVVGTSHCEPMLCNINTEWDSKNMGEWRYDNNSGTIKELFNERTKEVADYESIFTMGMRGEHDSPMIVGEDNTDDQVRLLEQVVGDQRTILNKNTGKDAKDIPQIFIPYKEVLTYYQNDMELPEDVTLVWTDDNYGYIRQLSNTEEQKRSGGAGVYYHTSYWGRPHDYLWLNSTNPVLMWEEMSKAYEFKAQNVWVLNCGDIKPHEYNIELFLDMAWDMSLFDKSAGVKAHMASWASREFGDELSAEITELMYENFRLAFQRRPEFMAWSQVEPVTKEGETELTQIHYGDEVTQRIADYQALINTADVLKTKVAKHRADAFYELVYYPIIGAASLNHKWLYSYKNQLAAQQNRRSAAAFGEKSMAAYERIESETKYYNEDLQDGKWDHIMSMSPRHLPVFAKPSVATSIHEPKAELGLCLESYQMAVNDKIINSYADVLPVFNAYTDNHYFIDAFLKGKGSLEWTIKTNADWIKVSQDTGKLNASTLEERVWVSIDWAKVPKGENKKEAPLGHDYQLIPPSYKVNSSIEFTTADTTIVIGISAFNPQLEELVGFNGFVEDKGFISINAENYTAKTKGAQAEWNTIDGVGYTGAVVAALPRMVDSQADVSAIVKNSPAMTYDFYSFNFGHADVHVQAVPTHAPTAAAGVRCAIAIDDAEPVIVDFQTLGRSDVWMQNVLKNAAVTSTKQTINKAGKHTLKIWMVDPGVMIDQVLIDLGGWKDSYAFPKESRK